MLRRRLYYGVKPWVPWALRVAVRRWLAARKRGRVSDLWPVLSGSGTPPPGWPGWPDGQPFAFVLTHDVEGPEGLAKCRRLMELEKRFGFRSCFNFIPEGVYRVPPELRGELTGQGFEVGVHDLHHDGRLFSSREAFRQRAARINGYLREWNAVGFRAGFMLHNLDWQHDLEAQYDASTFDTDPFEPQPEGVETIFPFWVPRPAGSGSGSEFGVRSSEFDVPNRPPPATCYPRPTSAPPSDFPARQAGYVELPYTLPQDSTLFLILREATPEIWLRKLDWVAEQGGMALVNVHPDYLQFEEEAPTPSTFNVRLYTQFLEYVRQRYGDRFWQPVPREVASYVASLNSPPIRRQPRRVGLVTYSFYECDTRVFRYGETLARRGDQVDVFALRSDPKMPSEEVLDGCRIFRLQTRSGGEQAKLSFLLPLLRFLGVASWRVTRRHARRPYDLLHVHNVPDFLVFAAWYPKLTGAKVLLDIHDLVPEFFASKFSVPAESLAVRLLRLMERASAAFADHVILANDLWLDKYASRSASREKCSVLLNYVEQRVFFPRPRTREDGRLILLFPGGLQPHQGVDIAIRAFHRLAPRLPNAEFHIYGDGSAKPDLLRLAHDLGLNGSVRFFGWINTKAIAAVMADADLGVVPKRADSFGNEAYSTKIMEFMSLGVPVVVAATKIDRHYFDDSVVRFFESGNPDALAAAMLEVLGDECLRRQMVSRASEFARRNSWEAHQADYLKLVDGFCAGKALARAGQGSASP